MEQKRNAMVKKYLHITECTRIQVCMQKDIEFTYSWTINTLKAGRHLVVNNRFTSHLDIQETNARDSNN